MAYNFSHECVDIAADYGIGGQYVTRLLDRAALFRGHPGTVRTDNGPEFTSRAFMAWTQTHGIRHILIQPGCPMQNGYIESRLLTRKSGIALILCQLNLELTELRN